MNDSIWCCSIFLEFFDFEMFEIWEANKFNIVLLSLDERFKVGFTASIFF